MNVELQVQDVIDVLKAQRNAALDELANQGAIIRSLRREIDRLRAEKPPTQQGFDPN